MQEATKVAVKDHSKRFGAWWLIALVALALVMWFAPQQGEVLVYKLCQVAIALILSLYADRAMFKHAPGFSPEDPRDVVCAARMLSRAVLVLAIIVGLTVGI